MSASEVRTLADSQLVIWQCILLAMLARAMRERAVESDYASCATVVRFAGGENASARLEAQLAVQVRQNRMRANWTVRFSCKSMYLCNPNFNRHLSNILNSLAPITVTSLVDLRL